MIKYHHFVFDPNVKTIEPLEEDNLRHGQVGAFEGGKIKTLSNVNTNLETEKKVSMDSEEEEDES